MAVSVSYPGVYVQEVSSGVRTIVGVGTSIGMFIGRASGGELYKPVQCLSFEDVARNFTTEDGGSELIPSLRMFFANGGTNCYVMRIADDSAAAAKLNLFNEAKSPTLTISARGAGLLGNDIRVAINYNTAQPEATFNLDVFRWQKLSNGTLAKVSLENHNGLSMNPKSARYAEYIINRDSALISASDLKLAAAATGSSQSGYAISAKDDPALQAQIAALLTAGSRFGLSVDGDAAVPVDLAAQIAVFSGAAMAQAAMELALTNAINAFLPGNRQISVTLDAGPAGTAGKSDEKTKYLTISRAKGDVVCTPAALKDLASILMLGTAQGGNEISIYSANRPAANGVVSSLAGAQDLATLTQASFNAIEINGTEIALTGANSLKTTNAAVTGAVMFQDKTATASYNDGRGGLREKLAIIAAAIVAKRASDPSFEWSAEVWGNRLAIIAAGSSADGASATVRVGTQGAPFTALTTTFTSANNANVRYYPIGSSVGGTFYGGGASGNPGGAPGAEHYAKAYQIIDKEVDLFNLLVLPTDSLHNDTIQKTLWGPASVFCQQRRAFLLMDPPSAWTNSQKATDPANGVNALRIGLVKDHAAVMYPRLKVDISGKETFVGPSGAIAGLFSRIDSTRGVWKAPAGTEADLRGVIGVEHRFSDGENGVLNPKAVNTIRVFPNGIVNWGARTMDGDDSFGSEYKYIPIRRLALFMEESLYRGLKWAVFEPNDEPLWSQIRLNVGAFMHNLYRQGAFQGQTPRDAYFVKCDASTTTQNDRNLGIVNVVVGFAPLKPAEFVILSLQQMAGQIET